MDHLLVALLNTAAERPDPLETPLGVARWWAGQAPGGLPAAVSGKPRYDSALAEALQRLRSQLQAALAGAAAPPALRFRGDASDAILFEIAVAASMAARTGSLARIRLCARQACARYFLDETKNRSRRWCSLRCLERARVPRRRTLSR
jgi:predicted RNA-binding Zn ribbon-like protein